MSEQLRLGLEEGQGLGLGLAPGEAPGVGLAPGQGLGSIDDDVLEEQELVQEMDDIDKEE